MKIEEKSSHILQILLFNNATVVFLKVVEWGWDMIVLNRKSLHCTSPVARKLQLNQQCNAAQQLST